MRDLLTNEAFIVLLGTLFGGVGLKLVDHWIGKTQRQEQEAEDAKLELKKEIEALRDRLEKSEVEERRLESLVDDWKDKYWIVREEKSNILGDLNNTLDRLRHLEERLAQDGED